jgi:ectoine hydroxylase-related dioxygenase (phytanoyl-CoA dioxygenase family)
MTIPRLSAAASADDVLQALDEHGLAVVEQTLDRDDVARKKDELERVLLAVPTGRNSFEGFATRRVYALFAKTRSFDAQAIDPLLLAVAERALGAGFLLSAPTAISIGPGEAAQRLHRDDAVYPVARPRLDRAAPGSRGGAGDAGAPELVLNTMWALDDFTPENGATLVVPGSHRWPAERRAADGEAVPAAMPAGSVLFYVGSLLHAGGANRTAKPRLGVILEFCAGWLRPQENHFLGVPREIVRALPDRLRELLGYGIHGSLLGYVDGRHPAKFLDDTRAVEGGVVVAARGQADG